jgi:hypothetical protein
MSTKQMQTIRQDCLAYVTKMRWHLVKEVAHPGGCNLLVTDGSRTTIISISSHGKVALQGKDHALYQQIQHDLKPKAHSLHSTSHENRESSSTKIIPPKIEGDVAQRLQQRHLTMCNPRPSIQPYVFQPTPLNGLTEAAFFAFFGDYAFRQMLFLFSSNPHCFREELRSVCESETLLDTYLNFLIHYGFIVPEEQCWRRNPENKKSIGFTLEWYIRELFQRQFHGVAQDGIYLAELGQDAGDLDIVAFLGEHYYIAVESKAYLLDCEQQIHRVLLRFEKSQADLSIFYFDTLHPLAPVIPLLNRWLSSPLLWQVDAHGYVGTSGKGKIVVINAEPTIEIAFATVLQWYQWHCC